MSGSLNKVMLIGRLGKDPEIKTIPSGKKVANFSMATDEGYKKDGVKVEKTEWHKIIVWDKLAEIVDKYVKKGSLIYIEGKISTRAWDDKDGNKKYTTEITADTMSMLGGKTDGGSNQSSGQQSSGSRGGSAAAAEDADLPF